VRDRVDREMTRETGQRDHEGVRREQASYRPTHYGMRAQDHGALLASLARKVNALVDSHFRAGTPIFKAASPTGLWADCQGLALGPSGATHKE